MNHLWKGGLASLRNTLIINKKLEGVVRILVVSSMDKLTSSRRDLILCIIK